MEKDTKMVRIGLIGSIITAICCFTPVLVFAAASLGLSAYVGWLDIVLLPLLAVFLLMLLVGLVRGKSKA